jgi:DNA-binding SARP family transcriptional activator/tetratricopeptide (TPR) repeat protein
MDQGPMWFGLIGPLLVRHDDVEFLVPAAKQRIVLAALLLARGSVVSSARLSELVWNGRPPAGAAVTLRSYVGRLRQALGPAGQRIVTADGGYLIKAAEDEIDLSSYARLCGRGEAALQSRSWQQASDLLSEAERLWRGSPLADIPCQALKDTEVHPLEQLRLQATQWQIEADLQLGHFGKVVPHLYALTAEHPLLEPFHYQLMVALYRSGRQADALAAYRQARVVLVSEIGVEPAPELQLLHQQILAGSADPALPPVAAASAASAAPADLVTVPRQLPPPVASFVGRAAELQQLTEQGASLAMLISAIGGTAGVGKTALAVQWAHQEAGRYPDGQLYADLRGYDPGPPMVAADVLAGFLRALGVPSRDIPLEDDERAALYRSLLAGRKILVLLDNASAAEQVRALLPASPGCTAVVTSRDALAGLVARDGAHRLDLGLLPLTDAVRLLRMLIGGRVDAEPKAAAALAVCCCRLPLALRVAAELASARPAASLASLVGDLADQQRRLDLLDAGGDIRTAVRAVFSWSYRHLDPASARGFRLIGDHPGAAFDIYSVAALADLTSPQAGQLLDVLCRAHLVQPVGPGRYGMHDLLRAYAREVAATCDSQAERRTALTRLIDYYLHAAETAMITLYPAAQDRQPPVPPGPRAGGVADPAAARTWLDAELPNLVAVAAHSAATGRPDHVARLAAALFRYLDTGGHYAEAITIHTHARRAAAEARDRSAEAEALINLAIAEARQCNHQAATRHFEESLTLYREAGDRDGEARALGNLGIACLRQGHYQQATDHLQRALPMFRAGGNRAREASGLDSLGLACLRQGRYQQATAYLQQALDLSREIGSRSSEARALTNLGDVLLRQNRYQQATSYLGQSLAICRDTGDRVGEAYALASLGDLHLRQGRHQRSVSHYQRALSLFREIHDRSGEACALNGLGAALLAAGQPGQARIQHIAAVTLANQTGDIYQQARGHNGLGNAHHTTGNASKARDHWQQALTLHGDLGDPEADEVRARLSTAANRHRET